MRTSDRGVDAASDGVTRSQKAVLALILHDADESPDGEVTVVHRDYSRRLKESGYELAPHDIETVIRQLKTDGLLKFIVAGNTYLGTPDQVRPTAIGAQLKSQVINLVNISMIAVSVDVRVIQVVLNNLDSMVATVEKQTPTSDHEQVRALTTSLRNALNSREPKRIQQSLTEIQAWALANPADRAIAVIGLLLAIISLLLGLT